MKQVNTVLLDFDGTVMDTNDIIIKSWQFTFQHYEGTDRPLEQILETFGEPLAVTMEKLLPDVDQQEAIEVYRSYQVDHYRDLIQLFPGMKELILTLKEQGYKVAIVTSRLKRSTYIGLEKYGLVDCMDYILTADDTKKHKPDPEPVLVALDKLGSKPEEAIMVGDSMFDVLCAQNAGVKAVLVNWTMASEAQGKLTEMNPEYTIEKAEELLEILKEL